MGVIVNIFDMTTKPTNYLFAKNFKVIKLRNELHIFLLQIRFPDLGPVLGYTIKTGLGRLISARL